MPGRENALCIVVDRIFYAPHSTIFILFILGGFLNTTILSLDIVFKYEGMKIHLKMIGCLKVRPQKSLVQAHILACCQKFKFRPVQNKAYNLNRFEFMPMPSSWKNHIHKFVHRTYSKKNVNDSYIISFTIRFLSCRWWCGQTCHFSSCICRFKIVISCIRNCNLIAP